MSYTVRNGKLVREEKRKEKTEWVQIKPDPAKDAAWDQYYAAFTAKAMELLGKDVDVDDMDHEEGKIVESALAAEGISWPEENDFDTWVDVKPSQGPRSPP